MVFSFYYQEDKSQRFLFRRFIDMTESHRRIQQITFIAVLSCLAFILMIFELPNPFSVASYLKLDFSDIPVLLATWMYGPLSGFMVAFIKCFLHASMNSFSDWLGVLSSLTSSLFILLPFAWVFKKAQWKFAKQLYLGGAISTISLTVVMSALNWLVLVPVYMSLWGWHPSVPVPQLVALGVVPFNILKGILIAVIFSIIAKPLQSVLKHYNL